MLQDWGKVARAANAGKTANAGKVANTSKTANTANAAKTANAARRNSGRTGGGAVFASPTRLPLIPWENGFIR